MSDLEEVMATLRAWSKVYSALRGIAGNDDETAEAFADALAKQLDHDSMAAALAVAIHMLSLADA